MPYEAFDRLAHSSIRVGGSELRVGFAPGTMRLPQSTILAWIDHSAQVIAGYYGRFPVPSARILIVPVDGAGVRGGTTWGYRGAAIRILIGNRADDADLKNDWMLVHEMVHLALPDVAEQHSWLSEGLATYVEPIARAQAGDLSAAEIWSAMLKDMPRGLPQSGDAGLDHTATWARTYWGGALFCLIADIQIRQRTNNRWGLQDAMRGVLAAGGNHEAEWPLQRVLHTADQAVGVDVMQTLYAKMASTPVSPDLDALWNALGLRRQGGTVSFDPRGNLAPLREAITQARP